MRAVDKIGLTKEAFFALYKKYGGFDEEFNRNHPSYRNGESFTSFLNSGSEKLIDEESKLVESIINIGEL